MDIEPDYEFDAYLQDTHGRKLLCDVKIWLPTHPSEDARIEAVAMGVEADSVIFSGPLISIVTDKDVEAQGLRFEAKDVFIRRASSLLVRRKAGGTKLLITHIGRLVIESRPAGSPSSPSSDAPKLVQFVLSDISYAIPQPLVEVDYRGNRTVHSITPTVLRIFQKNGAIFEFEFDRDWSWRKESRSRISAASFPVLNLLEPEKHSEIASSKLASIADDVCILLSLAARHRVVVHAEVTIQKPVIIKEWRYPLARLRATTEEEADGSLIDSKDIDDYFSTASKTWCGLNNKQHDAIRLAIFSLHPTSGRTIEAKFIDMFFALENIEKAFGSSNKPHLRDRMEYLFEQYPVFNNRLRLWPLFSSSNDISLYWLRNELAHGGEHRQTMPRALVIASNHLQLWIERLLLSLLGFTYRTHHNERLYSRMLRQQDSIAKIQEELRTKIS